MRKRREDVVEEKVREVEVRVEKEVREKVVDMKCLASKIVDIADTIATGPESTINITYSNTKWSIVVTVKRGIKVVVQDGRPSTRIGIIRGFSSEDVIKAAEVIAKINKVAEDCKH